MQNTGKWVVVGLVGLAVVAAAGAVAYQYAATHRALGLWGPDGAQAIRSGERVRLLLLEPLGRETPEDIIEDVTRNPKDVVRLRSGQESPFVINEQELTIDGERMPVYATFELDEAKGLTHLRTALVTDDSFQWDQHPDAGDVQWDFALTFTDGLLYKQFAVSQEKGYLWDFDSERPIALSETVATGMRTYFEPYLNGEAAEAGE